VLLLGLLDGVVKRRWRDIPQIEEYRKPFHPKGGAKTAPPLRLDLGRVSTLVTPFGSSAEKPAELLGPLGDQPKNRLSFWAPWEIG